MDWDSRIQSSQAQKETIVIIPADDEETSVAADFAKEVAREKGNKKSSLKGRYQY